MGIFADRHWTLRNIFCVTSAIICFATQNTANAQSAPPFVSKISFNAILYGGGGVFNYDTGASLFDLSPTPNTPSSETLTLCDSFGRCLGTMIVTATFLRWNQSTSSDEVRISYDIRGVYVNGSTGGNFTLDGHGPFGQVVPIDDILIYDAQTWRHSVLGDTVLSFSTDEFPNSDSFTVDYEHVNPCIPPKGPEIASGAFCPSTPEPSTWTYLIAGFGLIGAALRGRGMSLADRH